MAERTEAVRKVPKSAIPSQNATQPDESGRSAQPARAGAKAAKAAPTKATAAKAAPTKAAKATPAKVSPAKVTPAKTTAAKTTPAKAATVKATSKATKTAPLPAPPAPVSPATSLPAKKAAKPAVSKAAPSKAAPAKAATAPAGKAPATAKSVKKAAAPVAPAVKAASKTASTPVAKTVELTKPALTKEALAKPVGVKASRPVEVTSANEAAGKTVGAPASGGKATKTTTAAKTPPRTVRTPAETEKIRTALTERRDELRAEYEQTMAEITEAQRDRLIDSAGDDQADTGTKTHEREQEISLANSIRERVEQVERALERLDDGQYGWCERCGNPIPVERLAAFPSATLCVSCKQLEERR